MMGRADSQLVVPFSQQIVRDICRLGGRDSFRSLAILSSICLRNFWALDFLLAFSHLVSGLTTSDRSRNKLTRGPAIVSQVEYCSVLLSFGFEIPRPLRWAGSANNSLSFFLGAFWPMRFGIKILLIVSSSGLISSSMFGVDLAKYVHLLDRPCVSAAKAACG